MALPVVAPQTGPAKRGPRQATAAQGNYLANQAARRPTVAPTTPPNKPNPFSASGVSSSPAASGSPGMSASGASSIPAASSAGASSTPASLGMTPSASGQMKRGGTVKRYAGGGATETNQYGSWGGANTANAINSVNAGAGGYSPGPLLTTPAAPSTGPFSTTPGTSPLGGGGGGGGGGSGGPTLPGTASNYQSALSGYNSNFGSTYVNARQDAVFGGSYTPYNVTNRGAWDTLTGGEQAYLEDKAGDFNGPSTGGIGLTAASGGSIPAFDDGGEVPDPGGVDPSQGQEGQAGDLAGALSQVQQAYQYGLQQMSGNIPTVPAGPGGDQTQGGPQDRSQQMADNSNAPRPIPPAPGGTPPQGVLQPTPKPFNPRDFLPGQQQSGAGQYTATAARGGSIPSFDAGGGVQGPGLPWSEVLKRLDRTNPPPSPTPPITPISPSSARGGSIPSFQPGGGVPPQVNPAAPPQVPGAQGAGVGGSPPHIMRYITGADSAPPAQVLQRQKSMDPKLPPTARTVHTIASAGGPQQQYQTLQAFRRLSDNAATHAKVSLTGNGKQPASLPHAVMFANKKFEYQPTPYHVSFALKGKGKPAQKAAAGGGIQSFDDGGGVGPDVGMSSSGVGDEGQQQVDQLQNPIAQLQDAGAPITMNVTDLNNGSTSRRAVTTDQLQSLLSGTYDSYVSQPKETMLQALQRVGGKVGQAVANTPTPEGGEINTTRTDPTTGVTTSANPEQWENRSDKAINPGNSYQGEPVTGNQPGVSPQAQAYNAANPQRKLGSPGEPSVADYDRAYGLSMQSRAGLAGRQPNAQEKTAIDQMNKAGGTPTPPPSGGSGQQTQALPGGGTRVTEAALHNPVAETNQEQQDIEDQVVQQRQQNLSDAIRLKEAGVNSGNAVNPSGGTRFARPNNTRTMQSPRGGGRATGGKTASGKTHAPRRVFGRGHAGLGTYQELADGTAQYLGPQNLTG